MSIPSISKHTPGLPTWCRSWCVGTHKQALEEGCTVEESRLHRSADVGGQTADLVNHRAQRLDRPGGGAWDLQLYADPGPEPHYYGLPLVKLEVREDLGRVELSLTSGEARTLAAQLLHYADTADLPDPT
jgi:hypothetical protein